MRVTWNGEPFCTLKPPFDKVFNALFNNGSHSKRPLRKNMFYKVGHISGPRRSPDMILSITCEISSVPPRACRQPNTK